MKIRWHCLLALAVLATAGTARADLYGYLEARYLKVNGAGPIVPSYSTTERVRPTLVEKLNSIPGVTITATPQFLLNQFEDEPMKFQKSSDYLTVERLYADIDAGPARVRIGRQAVNWGSALIWNPTDVFQEVFLTDYWSERQGLNALRVYVPLPKESRVTAVVTTGDTLFYQNRYALKASITRWGTDFSGVWMDDTVHNRLVWGIDLKGNAGVGYWIEAADFAPKDGGAEYQQAVLGVDYSFPVLGTLYLAAQYYYDGSGAGHPENYNFSALSLGTRRTLAMHYANLIATLNINPDLAFSALAIENLDDSTYLVTPYLVYTYKNFRVTGGVNLAGGPEGGEFNPHPSQDRLGIVPDTAYYLWGRWYF